MCLPPVQRTLPNVQVAISCFDRTHTVDAESPAINPRFARNKQRFENVALSNVVSIKVCISLWCVCCVCLCVCFVVVGECSKWLECNPGVDISNVVSIKMCISLWCVCCVCPCVCFVVVGECPKWLECNPSVALSNVVCIKVCISLWCVCCVCVLWLMVSVQNGWSAIQVWIRVMQGREMRACVGTMLPFREELVLQAF